MSDDLRQPAGTSSIPVFVPAPAAPPRRRYWLHALLLAATILTTLIIGARLQYNFMVGQPAYATDQDFVPIFWALAQPSRLLLGIPFSATLLAILLAHEMGHFLAAMRHGVRATLPYFIPAPTLIGTMGAFIRIRSRIPSRDVLFDVGVAGPIAGFVLALPATVIGLMLSKPMPALMQVSRVKFNDPPIFQLTHWMLAGLGSHAHATTALADFYLHPVAVAAWVGMFATALNLIPGGQLDGGHLVYAVSPRHHGMVSRITLVLLIPLALFFWTGWMLWALLLYVSGTRHPAVSPWPELNPNRIRFAWAALAIFMLTFMPAPIPDAGIIDAVYEFLE